MRLNDTLKDSAFISEAITIYSNCEVFIENYKSIIECNEILIKLKTNKMIISVWGQDLLIYNSQEHTIKISGKIERVELENRGRSNDK